LQHTQLEHHFTHLEDLIPKGLGNLSAFNQVEITILLSFTTCELGLP